MAADKNRVTARNWSRKAASKTNLVRGTVSWGCDDLEEDVEPEVVGQVGLGRHEDDHDRRSDPEDEPTAEQVAQVAVHSMKTFNSNEHLSLITSYLCHNLDKFLTHSMVMCLF